MFKDTIAKFQDFFGGFEADRNPLKEINLFDDNIQQQEFEDLPIARKTLTIIFQKEKRPSISNQENYALSTI